LIFRVLHDLTASLYGLLRQPVRVEHDLSNRAAEILGALLSPPCATRHVHFSWLTISPGSTVFEGDFIVTDVTITDLQSISGVLFGTDAEGHETTLEGATVTATSNNTAVCSASVEGDRLRIAADGTDLGLAQVTLDAVFEDQVIDFFKRTLEFHGARVTCTPTYSEAVAEFMRRAPDLVVTEINLGGRRGGRELLAWIRDQHGGAYRVVAVTGYTEELRALAREGFDAVLPKPVDYEPLMETIAEVLERRRASGPLEEA
jgi:CheY-like chemotaxis protein